MTQLNAYAPDYVTARQRFRDAALRLNWSIETYPIGATGPNGEDLTLDVACSSGRSCDRVLLVSSGVHGVEGFFGSAVQVAVLEDFAKRSPPSVKCMFLHALNPFGFAWLRRFDESNVDPNRNFLSRGERYEGAPPLYAALDRLLNPRRPPTRLEPFSLKALWTIGRYGMPAVQQAVAAGQYEFPQGLFFGGADPSRMHQLLTEHLSRWLHGSRHVVHLDFHSGLGPRGEWKMLIEYPLSQLQRQRLTEWFGAGSFEECDSDDVDYDARGGLGRWCVDQKFAPDYLFACAEFGTYGPVQVLAGLRAENQAHHWGKPSSGSTVRTKERLKELFCPSAIAWRTRALDSSFDLVHRALQGLEGLDSAETNRTRDG